MRLRRPWALHVLVPAALLAFNGVVQGFYLRAPSSQDGMTYFERAAAFPDLPRDHWSLRIGLILPVRVLQHVFGYSEAAYYALPLLASALLVLVTYWLGCRLFNPTVGIAAAVLLVLNGIFLGGASILLPDLFATALLSSGLLLVVIVAQRADGAPWDRRAHVLLALAGVLLGWAYLVREFVVFVFPVAVVVFWAYRLPWKKLAWVAAPAAATFFVECLLNLVLYDSPFARLLVTGGHGGQRAYITDSRLDAIVRLPHALDQTTGTLPVLLLLAVLPFALFIRQPAFRVVAAWFVTFWVAITLGTGLIDPSFRFIIADKLRYWTPVLPAIVIGGVAVVQFGVRALCSRVRLPARWNTLIPATAIIAAALVVGFAGTSDDRSSELYRTNGATQLLDLRTWLAGPGHDVGLIWTDPSTARLIPVYTRTTFGNQIWKGEVRTFEGFGRFFDASQLDHGAVVIYRFGYRILFRRLADGRQLLPHRLSPIRGWVRHPPPGWERAVYRSDRSLVVYRIGSGG